MIQYYKMEFQIIIVLTLLVRNCIGALREISTCHEDFSLNPRDGFLKRNTFTWLGFAEYIHVTTGLPHQYKAPRVTLIQKQFVIGTAMEFMRFPRNYKVGNVIFGEYERDEQDCGLTRDQLKLGATCPRAYLEIPTLDVILHPEFSRFGVSNSLALVKLLRPMKSYYMLPICLPSIQERTRIRKNRFVFMVDYMSSVPQNFDRERMGKRTVKLFTHKECRRHRLKSNLGSEGVTHVLCSSGCGVRTGTPIVSQNTEGAFELIGVAASSGECSSRSMRRRFIKEPPLYVDVYPYATWIINVITANELPLPYPRRFKFADTGAGMTAQNDLRKKIPQKDGWRGRTYVSGNFCFKSNKKQRKGAFFYKENFEVNADPPARMRIFMKISAGIECTIVCARLQLPNRLVKPTLEGVSGYNISISFLTDLFPYSFSYTLGLTGRNSTKKNLQKWVAERNDVF